MHQSTHLPKSVYNIIAMVQAVLPSDIQHAPMAKSQFYSSKAKELIQQVLKQKLTGVVYNPELAPLLVKEITEDVKTGLRGEVFCTAIICSDNWWCVWDSHYKKNHMVNQVYGKLNHVDVPLIGNWRSLSALCKHNCKHCSLLSTNCKAKEIRKHWRHVFFCKVR